MNYDDEALEQLILDGIVEFAGLDENGEMLYAFAADLEQKNPKLYRLVNEMHLAEIYLLWELGYLSIDDITLSDPMVRITEKALNSEEVSKLNPGLQLALKDIIRHSRKDT